MDTQTIGQLGAITTVVGIGGLGSAICSEEVRNGRGLLAGLMLAAGAAMLAIGDGTLRPTLGCHAQSADCSVK